MSAKKNQSEPDVEVEVEDAAADEEKEEVAVEAAAPEAEVAATTPTKKPLGVKEVIPFKWKLVGGSAGMILTLFKAVELEDVEAQLERLSKEGYYKDLRIMDVNEKIDQPKQTVRAREKVRAAAKSEKDEKDRKAEAAAKAPRAARSEPVRISRSASNPAPVAKSTAKSSKAKSGKTKPAAKKKAAKKKR